MSRGQTSNNLSPESFEVLFKQSPTSTQIFAANGDTIMVNKAWEEMWQIHSEDIRNYNIFKDAQLLRNGLMPKIKSAFAGEKVAIPALHYIPDSTLSNLSQAPHKWVRAIFYPIIGTNKEVTHVVVQHENVVMPEDTQQDLLESEARFRAFFDANIVGVFTGTLDGKFLEANDMFLSMIGYSREELQEGKVRRDLLTPPEYTDLTTQVVKSLLTQGHTTTYEKEYFRKDGSRITLLLAVARIGQTDKSIGFALDITQRKHNEEANYQLAAIVASSEDAIISKTLQSDITSWNGAAERLFGYTAQEALGKNIRFIIPSYLQSEEDQIVEKIEKGERIEHYQTERIKKDGTVVPVSLTISPIYNNKKEIIGISNITRDITLQKQHDQEKSDFLSMVSHELKTPLTSMKMFIELVGRQVEPTNLEEAKYIITRIKDQTNQLVELTNDLLDVSRIETGKLRLHKEQFPLQDLVQETVEALVTSTRAHKLTIVGNTEVDVVADRYRIFQVLVNFLTNAIKYSPHGKDILVRLDKKDNEVIVSVQDFGIGISKGQQEKIFERLYQVNDKEAKTYPGLGLGLYISKEIIERHNGRIWLESAKGKGSTFYFSLPLGK